MNARTLNRDSLVGIATLLLLVWSSPASAKTSVQECMWNNLSAVLKASIYETYDKNGVDGLENVNLDNAKIEHLHAVCLPGTQPSVAQLQATGIVLVGVAQEHAAAHHLAQAAGVPFIRLRKAWQSLSPDEREQFRGAYRKGSKPDVSTVRVISPILDKAARLAGWKPIGAGGETADQLSRHYVQALLGMAQSEAFADAM